LGDFILKLDILSLQMINILFWREFFHYVFLE
jgi:hypothetical protein